jgi:hypothetical protein
MTAKELLKKQFDDAGYQLEKVFNGVDSSLDFKLTAHSMSPRELATHLAECYFAVIKESKGEKHSWGTYTPNSTEWPALLNEMKELREKATAAALEAEGWEDHANGFIVAHDYYHVGQMALIRMKQDASWDPYSIYNWG